MPGIKSRHAVFAGASDGSAKGTTVVHAFAARQNGWRVLHLVSAVAIAASITGCISYSPAEVSAMSAYKLCEAHLYERVNLTADTRAQVSSEIRKRNEDCSRQVPSIEAERELQRYDAMYGRSGP